MRNSIVGVALFSALTLAAAQAEEKHHPPAGDGTAAAPTQAAPAANEAASGGMGMMARARSREAMLLAPNRIEGRLAYLRAEFAPSATQEAAFVALAESLRAVDKSAAAGEAAGMGMMGHGMMAGTMGGMMAAGTAKPVPPLAERLAHAEHAESARVEALRAVRGAHAKLAAGLGAEQRRTLDELLPILFPALP